MITPDKTGPLLTIVVAVAENGVIGASGELPWRISDDLRWFKRVTMGKPVIMGRKTYESIGKPLPGRKNIVLTRSDCDFAEGVARAATIDDARSMAAEEAIASGVTEVCVIGGAEIYAAALTWIDRIYFTLVRAEVEGDAHFPPLDLKMWRKIRIRDASQSEVNEFSCEFFIFDRICDSA